MCKAYANLPPAGPNAPLKSDREVRYKAYAPKIYHRQANLEHTSKE